MIASVMGDVAFAASARRSAQPQPSGADQPASKPGILAENPFPAALAKPLIKRVERRTSEAVICPIPPQAIADHPSKPLMSLSNSWGMV
jgi:hypothetical protein